LTARRGKGLSNRKNGGGAGPGGRLLVILFRGEKAVLVLPRVFSLKQSTLGAFAAFFKALSRKSMAENNALF